MQMTGRVRNLGDPVVFCCCAKGIQISHPPKDGRVTLEDVKSFARWVDDNVKNVVGDCFFLDPVTAENARFFNSIPESLWLDMLSYNEARHLNGQQRFFVEVRELLLHQGHKVTIDYTSNKGGVELHDCPKVATTNLLEAPDVSPRSFKQARDNVFEVSASATEKAIYYRGLYKEAWGLETVDAAFVEAHGPEIGSESQALIVRMLCPAAAPQHVGEHWLTKSLIFKAICVGETVEALGLKHPLDTDTIITDLQPLLSLSFIQHWNFNAKMFIARPVPGKVLDDRGLIEVCKSIFKSLGIRLEMSIKRPRGADGKQHKQRSITLNKEDCQEVGELLQLKGVMATEFEGVNEWLLKHPVQRWAHLCKPKNGETD